jgi:hypothetical protein
MSVTGLILLLSVVGFGILFLRLHTLPERVAHKSHKVQFEIVAILGLLALFTHMHIFWVAGLLLAFVDLPDFGGPIGRIAGSVEKIAGIKPGKGADEAMAEAENAKHVNEATDEHSEAGAQARKSEPSPVPPTKPRTAFPEQKEKVRA